MRLLLLVCSSFFIYQVAYPQQKFPVKIDSKWGLIDDTGKIITEPVFEAMGQFRQFGYAHIQQNGKVGLINSEGNIVIAPQYNEIKILENNLFAVKQEKWNVIDASGKTKLQSDYDRVDLIAPGFLGIMTGLKWGMASQSGSVVCAPTFDGITPYRDFFKITQNDKIGLMDAVGKIILTPENDDLKIFNNNSFLFLRNRKWGAVNQSGEIVVPLQYDAWTKVSADFIQLKTKAKYHLYCVNSENVLIDHPHDRFLTYSKSKAVYYELSKAGLLDEFGNVLLDAEYKEVMMFTDEIYRVKLKGKWGVVGPGSEILVPIEYDYISPVRNGVAVLRKNNLSGLVNAAGTILSEPQYSKVEIKTERVQAFRGDKLTLLEIDDSGTLVESTNFKRHKRIKIGAPRNQNRSFFRSGSDNNNLLEDFEWFFDSQVEKWGLRKLEDGEYQIEPTFDEITVHKPLGFTIVGLEKTIRQDFDRTSYGMEFVFGLVNNEKGLIISLVNMWDIRTEDLYEGLPAARCVFEDGRHGLLNAKGKLIHKDFAYIGDFKDGIARYSKKGMISGSLQKNAKGLDEKVEQYIGSLETRSYMIDYTTHDRKFNRDAVLTCNDCLFGYMDTLGNQIIAPNYTFAKSFVNHTGLVEDEGKWGMVDSSGIEVLTCQYDGIRYLEDTENTVVEVFKKTKKYGLIDSTGHVNLDLKYDEIASMSDERFAVKNQNKWGFTDLSGNEVISCDYKKVRPFSDTIAAVRKGSKWGYINKSGQEILPFHFRKAGDFKEDKIWVSKKSKIGYINKKGAWLIPEQFDKAFNFKNGKAVVSHSGKYGVIDAVGDYIVKPKFKFINEFNKHNLAIIKYGNNNIKWGVINELGEIITKKSFKQIKPYQEGVAVVKGKSGYGVIDTLGRLIVDTKYTTILDFSEGRAAVQRNGKWGFIDPLGNEVIPLEFTKCLNFEDGIAVVYKGYRKAGLIDRDGNFVIEPSINRMVGFSNGRGKVRSADRNSYYFIGKNATVEDMNYDMARDFQHGVAAVKSGSHWGIINTQGIELISPKFEKIEAYQNGYAKVRINRLFGLVNLKGNVIVPPQFEYINYAGNGLFRVEQGDRIGYFSKNGEWVWELKK